MNVVGSPVFYLRITWLSMLEKPRRLPLLAFRCLSDLRRHLCGRSGLVARSEFVIAAGPSPTGFTSETFEVLDVDGLPIPAAVVIGEFRRIEASERRAAARRFRDRCGRAGRGWNPETFRSGPVPKALFDRPKRKYKDPGTWPSVRAFVHASREEERDTLPRSKRSKRMLGDNDWDGWFSKKGCDRSWKAFRRTRWKA